MITITLEGNTWSDILREMSIIEASVRGSRIEDLPDKGIVAPDDRECQGRPKKPVCAYCGVDLGEASVIDWHGNLFCSAACEHRHRCSSEQTNIAKDCQKCRGESMGKLQWILGEYFLGPEERAEILERVRQ